MPPFGPVEKKSHVYITNREDTDQTASEVQKQSDLGLLCLSRPFWLDLWKRNIELRWAVGVSVSSIRLHSANATVSLAALYTPVAD